MQHLSKLLQVNESDLARILRLSLHGLRAELKEALHTAKTEDPGINTCRELLGELDQLLESSPQQSTSNVNKSCDKQQASNLDSPFETATSQPKESPFQSTQNQPTLKLTNLVEEFTADLELKKYLGDFQLQSINDLDLWDEMQRLLLRVPIKIGADWQQRSLKIAQELSVIPSERISFYPDLNAIKNSNKKLSDFPLSKSLLVDPRVKLEYSGKYLDILAKIVSIWLEYIENDPHLHHALKSLYLFGVKPLDEAERTKYVAVLLEYWQRAQLAEQNQDLVAILRSRLDLDEAINSLVYRPLVAPDSWWGKLQQEARTTLFTVANTAHQAGLKVIRLLNGPYADIRLYSKDDIELDEDGNPGEVSTCLRVYAQINEEVYPGRVLYRSLR